MGSLLMNVLGCFLIVAGIIAIAGSAGDCAGKCMEYANSYYEMFMAMGIGFMLVGTGAFILYKY